MAWLAPLHNWSHRRWGKFSCSLILSLVIPYAKKIYSLDIIFTTNLLQLLLLKPKRYGLDHKENLSGEGEELIYHSKGHALNPGQRKWTRYQPWEGTTKPWTWFSFELQMSWIGCLFFFPPDKSFWINFMGWKTVVAF